MLVHTGYLHIILCPENNVDYSMYSASLEWEGVALADT